MRRGECRSQSKTLSEKIVTNQDAGVLVPTGVHRRHVSSRSSLVEHVVVNERRGVDHFYHRSQNDMILLEATQCFAYQKKQCGSKPLSTKLSSMLQDRFQIRMPAFQLALQKFLHLMQLIGDGAGESQHLVLGRDAARFLLVDTRTCCAGSFSDH